MIPAWGLDIIPLQTLAINFKSLSLQYTFPRNNPDSRPKPYTIFAIGGDTSLAPFIFLGRATGLELLVGGLDLRKGRTVLLIEFKIDGVVDVVKPLGERRPGLEALHLETEGTGGLAVGCVTIPAILARKHVHHALEEIEELGSGLRVGFIGVGKCDRVKKYPCGGAPDGRLETLALLHVY